RLHHLFGEAAGVPGAWGHAIGGMGSITQAMAKACREAGVDIVLNSPVEEVIVSGGRAAGVVAGGKAWRSKSVIAGVNPKLLFDRLVPGGAVDADVASRMHGWKCESATFRMNVALSELPRFKVLPKRGNHLTAGIIMAPSLDYMHRAWLDAAVNGWTKQPIVEMLIPSTLDSTLAPKGQHVASLFCQHFRYDLGPGRSWDKERERAADQIIATVDAHAPGFAKSILGRQIHSPLDLERRFGLIGGDIFHGKMGLDQLFSARPMVGAADYRMPLKGLYLCGSGAHPGGGVTGAPGHNAARAILADRRPWRRRRRSHSEAFVSLTSRALSPAPGARNCSPIWAPRSSRSSDRALATIRATGARRGLITKARKPPPISSPPTAARSPPPSTSPSRKVPRSSAALTRRAMSS